MKEIVILANSVMHSKSCIAGKIYNQDKWIRLKGEDVSGITFKEECLNKQSCNNKIPCICSNFLRPKILDVVQAKIVKNKSIYAHQTEDHKFDTSIPLGIVNKKISSLSDYTDSPETIWGKGNRVCSSCLGNNSLYFLEVDSIELYKTVNEEGKVGRRAKILYNKVNYDLAVTAREFENLWYNNQGKSFKAYVTVSLGEVYYGYAYKLVAGIVKK